MPRDLFGDVTDPSVRVGSRKWYTVPLSLAAHTFVVLLIVVIPLMATGTLPVPSSNTTFMAVTTPPVPAPPPVRRVESPTPPAANAAVVPLETPDTIAPETGVEAGFENEVTGATDILGAVVDGVGALPEPPAPKPPTPPAPVPVGGRVRAPQKVHDVAPVYPSVALSARMEGVVIIEAIIGTDGRVQDARLLRPSPLLEQAALAAVRQWIYTPTTLNGVPVPVIMTVTVRFQIHR